MIQECSKRSAELAYEGYFGQWVGDSAARGLGVFCKENWRLSRLGEAKDDDPKWIVPYQVRGAFDFTLIAVWACAVEGSSRENYIGQIHRALKKHPEWFVEAPVFMAGDLNSNAIFDKKQREESHLSMVDQLNKYGLDSVYHAHGKHEHGLEKHATFYMNRRVDKPFHLDYIFMPSEWQAAMSVEVGSHAEWASTSDHCPITVEVFPNREVATNPSSGLAGG